MLFNERNKTHQYPFARRQQVINYYTFICTSLSLIRTGVTVKMAEWEIKELISGFDQRTYDIALIRHLKAQFDNLMIEQEKVRMPVFFSHVVETASGIVQEMANEYASFITVQSCQSFLAGSLWRDQIEQGIRNCHIFVVIVTKDWERSRACQEEYNIARAGYKIIVPVILNCEKSSNPTVKYLLDSHGVVIKNGDNVGLKLSAFKSSLMKIVKSLNRGKVKDILIRLYPQYNSILVAIVMFFDRHEGT
jgi:hypothetical protein